VKNVNDKLWQEFEQLANQYPDDHGVRMTSDMARWLTEERLRMLGREKPSTSTVAAPESHAR
jgi:hypothetical protein